jgi:hypothetical protein
MYGLRILTIVFTNSEVYAFHLSLQVELSRVIYLGYYVIMPP